MRRLTMSLCAAITLAACVLGGIARAEDPAADAEFLKRLFAGPLDKDKSYACFVRVYDRAHLGRHPLQKVSAMKLLMTAEKEPEAGTPSNSFRLGVTFVKRSGNFDSSGACTAGFAEIAGASKAQFGCGVDCDGGGISIELTREDKATLVRLERIRIWRNNKPEDEGLDLSGGADDRVFRLDRVKLDQCKSLITDRKELAAIRTLPTRRPPLHRRNILRASLTALGGLFAAAEMRPAQAAAPDRRKVVYHLSDFDKVGFVLGNIRNHLDGVGGPAHVTIALVVHGPALKAFRATAANPDLKKRVGDAREAGVELNACAKTLQGAQMTLADLLPGFISADGGGVVRLAELQAQGYVYIRP